MFVKYHILWSIVSQQSAIPAAMYRVLRVCAAHFSATMAFMAGLNNVRKLLELYMYMRFQAYIKPSIWYQTTWIVNQIHQII